MWILGLRLKFSRCTSWNILELLLILTHLPKISCWHGDTIQLTWLGAANKCLLWRAHSKVHNLLAFQDLRVRALRVDRDLDFSGLLVEVLLLCFLKEMDSTSTTWTDEAFGECNDTCHLWWGVLTDAAFRYTCHALSKINDNIFVSNSSACEWWGGSNIGEAQCSDLHSGIHISSRQFIWDDYSQTSCKWTCTCTLSWGLHWSVCLGELSTCERG